MLCSKKPLYALRALLSVRHGRAAFKAAVAAHVLPNLEAMPVDDSVREVIKRAREKGRKVYLATAADHRFAQAISNSMGTFDGIFASKEGVKLKGQAKADRIIAAFGTQGFDYIGNDG